VNLQVSSDNDQYKQLFIEEAKEHVDNLSKCLLTLEKEPQNQDVVNSLFRSAHTLKGSSGMMGYKDFQELTHAMEDVFDGMRKGNAPTSAVISVMLECVDELSARLQSIQEGVQSEIDVTTFKAKLGSAVNVEAKPGEPKKEASSAPTTVTNNSIDFDQTEKDAVAKAESNGKHCYIVDLTFSKDCMFKNLRAGMVLDKVTEVAEVVKSIPNQKDMDEEKLGNGFKIAVTSNSDEDTIKGCVNQVLEVDSVQVSPFDGGVGTGIKDAPADLPPPGKEYVVTIDNGKVTKVLSEVQSAQTVRVKFDHLDRLMNWVGELVINKIALLQVTADNHNEGLKRITENIDRLTADLQDLVMKVRMVPVSQVFDRFPRLVRDLSLKKGKKIELFMEGASIEVDRTVLDEIGEPLIHLLRNSIDHGIEMPADREAGKKPAAGKIRLAAMRNGDHVIIEVEDDGAGIDPEKIRKAAVKKGFATEAEAEKMNNDQLVNLVFLPGFSTAKEVSDTSGRGVGMDVVKTKIASLGGTVHLDTNLGRGTKTIIKLPLTLAIIQAILVNDSGQTFAIPTSQVSEIVQAHSGDVKSLGKSDAIVVRDRVIPLVHLHSLLGIKAQEEENPELLITYLGDESTKVGLAVDSVLRQQDILVKPLNGVLKGIRGISGATILGDGQVVLVIDVGQFVKRGKSAA
jgi:two-component system, chemotaxis family, sensor kinase CheA